KLDEAVKKARLTKEWRHEFMTLSMKERLDREKGREEGMEKGREEGREKERKNIIIKMIKQGFTDFQILSVCDTSIEEIEDCKKNI
uniref:hypothetical protein n=1 Tax=Thomasclavelia cocleata TaxID=69824 RepID=UPI00272A8AAB